MCLGCLKEIRIFIKLFGLRIFMISITENDEVLNTYLDSLVEAYDANNPIWSERQRREQALKRFHDDYTSILTISFDKKRSKHATLGLLRRRGVQNPLKFFDYLTEGVQGRTYSYKLRHTIGVWTDTFEFVRKRTNTTGLTPKYLE